MDNLPIRVKFYNKKRKPWRSRNWFGEKKGSKGVKCRLLRGSLCGLIFFESLVILHIEGGIKIPWIENRLEITEKIPSDKEKDDYLSQKTGHGISIDLKKGILRFWKTEEVLQSEENNRVGDR